MCVREHMGVRVHVRVHVRERVCACACAHVCDCARGRWRNFSHPVLTSGEREGCTWRGGNEANSRSHEKRGCLQGTTHGTGIATAAQGRGGPHMACMRVARTAPE